jgi:hypothetical protein
MTMKYGIKYIGLILYIMFLSGCANPGIVKVSPDTYLLSRMDKGGMFGNVSAMKADVILEANEFAERQGKIAIPINLAIKYIEIAAE